MDHSYINGLLDKVKLKLESLHPDRLQEGQTKASQHSPKRMSAAKARLAQIYAKQTSDTDPTKINATGAKRRV